MSEPWFHLPGNPVVAVIVTVLAKIASLLALYMILLMVIRFYVSADSTPVNAIRRFVGLAIGVPFAACATRIFGRHFFMPDPQFETLVFVVFVAFMAAITAFVNPPPRKEEMPHAHPDHPRD